VIYEVLGNRQAVILKEMTKVYEKVWRGALEEVLKALPKDEIIGEFTLIVDGKTRDPGSANFNFQTLSPDTSRHRL